MIDDRSPRRVHQERARLHGRELGLADHRSCRVGQRDAELYDVGRGEELVEIHPLDVGVGRSARRTDHVHVEHSSEISQFRSDGAETDHAHPFAAQLGALEAVTHAPVPGFDRRVDFHRPSRQGQHQHEGVFRNRGRGEPGRVDDRHAGRRRRTRVDVVETGSATRHHDQIGQCGDQLPIDLSASAGDDRAHTPPVRSRVEGSEILHQLHGVGRLEDALRIGMHRFEEEDHEALVTATGRSRCTSRWTGRRRSRVRRSRRRRAGRQRTRVR